MAGSIDHVLQPDGTYKWEVVEQKAKSHEVVEACPAPAPKAKKETKKVSKKKSTRPLSD